MSPLFCYPILSIFASIVFNFCWNQPQNLLPTYLNFAGTGNFFLQWVLEVFVAFVFLLDVAFPFATIGYAGCWNLLFWRSCNAAWKLVKELPARFGVATMSGGAAILRWQFSHEFIELQPAHMELRQFHRRFFAWAMATTALVGGKGSGKLQRASKDGKLRPAARAARFVLRWGRVAGEEDGRSCSGRAWWSIDGGEGIFFSYWVGNKAEGDPTAKFHRIGRRGCDRPKLLGRSTGVEHCPLSSR